MKTLKSLKANLTACFLPCLGLLAILLSGGEASAALPEFFDTEMAKIHLVVADFGAAAAAVFAMVIAAIGAYQLLKSLGHFVIKWWASIARKMG